MSEVWGDSDSPWVATAKYVFTRDRLDQWDNNAVYRLCILLRCRVEDLCAHAGLFDRETIAEFVGANRWPCWLTVQWQKILRFKTGCRGADRQDALAVKMFDLTKQQQTTTDWPDDAIAQTS